MTAPQPTLPAALPRRFERRSIVFLAAAFVICAAFGSPARAIDFLRGDANSDGVVSICDSHQIFHSIFRTGADFACDEAADITGDGRVIINDGARLMDFLFGNAAPPPAPFPEPGPLGLSRLGCESYGGVQPLEDPSARIEILHATASGGDTPRATITIGIANATDVGGFSLTLFAPDGVLISGTDGRSTEGESKRVTDLAGVFDQGTASYRVDDDGRLRLGVLFTMVRTGRLEPSAAVRPVVELEVCVPAGTAAGGYPLVIEEAELIDFDSARRIIPDTVGATLSVAADIGADVVPNCTTVRPDPGPSPDARFILGTVDALPGADVEMPFRASATAPIQALAFSIDYDESTIEATDVREVHAIPPDQGFRTYTWNSLDENSGENGFDEGYVYGAWVFSFTSPLYNLPADVEHDVLSLSFRARPEAEAGDSAHVTFLNGAPAEGTDATVQNILTALGRTSEPTVVSSVVFVNAAVKIIDEITIFLRGDANGDNVVELSDAQTTLGWLFQGARAPHCLDAADANDDGEVDIADPVMTLNFLFLGGPELPAPSPAPGNDPTPDAMGCLGSTSG